MTPQQIEALKLALEALEEAWIFAMSKFQPTEKAIDLYDKARAAIKEALADHAMRETQRLGQEIEQEPVQFKCTVIDDVHPNGIPLEQWTPPPQRKPLTDEEIDAIADEYLVDYRIPAGCALNFARDIEAAHGIKGDA